MHIMFITCILIYRNMLNSLCLIKTKYSNYYISEIFLQFAEIYFTKGNADPQHRPKYKTCLVRIPETYNLKCLNKGFDPEESKIQIIQKWNVKGLPIQLLLKNFRRWLIQEEINHKK
jgi:hypothetical protein